MKGKAEYMLEVQCARCKEIVSKKEFCSNCNFNLVLGPKMEHYQKVIDTFDEMVESNNYNEEVIKDLIEKNVPEAILFHAMLEEKNVDEKITFEKRPLQQALMNIYKNKLESLIFDLDGYAQFMLLLGRSLSIQHKGDSIYVLKQSLKFGEHEAALELGINYSYFRNNSEQAIYYLDKYFEKEDINNIPPELSGIICQIYGNSYKNEENYEKAVLNYEKGSKLGNYHCQVAMCEFSLNGWGVEKSLQNAIHWANMAFENKIKDPNKYWSENSSAIIENWQNSQSIKEEN